jgi:hypothetical protein
VRRDRVELEPGALDAGSWFKYYLGGDAEASRNRVRKQAKTPLVRLG